MSSSITIKDIAKMCGCGVSTVSRALNNHPDINEETRNRILSVVNEYSFVPNNSARNLKISDSKTIAVLIKGITNPFFTKMIKVMEQEIIQRKYSLILQHVEFDQDEIEVAIELEKEKKLKGIIFLGGYFNHPKEKMDAVGVPFVISTVNMNVEYQDDYCSVSINDVKESYKIVDYLCKLGHKKILMIAADERDVSIGKLRREGYTQALEANGIEVDEHLILPMSREADSYSMEAGFLTMRNAIARGLDFTAVFAISDAVAIGACRALSDAGKQIPQDVSVAGFDGIDYVKYFIPRITTIRQPFEDMAKESITLLFKYIDDENENASSSDNVAEKGQDSSNHQLFEGELIIGDSTREI